LIYFHINVYFCAIFLYCCTIQISVAHEVKTFPVHAMNENAGVNV